MQLIQSTLVHHQGIVHRDIKPANLLLTEDHRVKISDFGVSHHCEGDISNEVTLAQTAGTPAFFAPELCAGSKGQYPITKAIDIWALGVTLYCFVYGKIPFHAQTEYDLYEAILNNPFEIPPSLFSTLALATY